MKSALADLYRAHVAERQRTTERALAETGFDRLLLHSGVPHTYFADDKDAPFHPTPHFAHWAPVEGPGHVLEVRPGKKPRLVRFVSRATSGTSRRTRPRLRRGRVRGRRRRDARRASGPRVGAERRADRVHRRARSDEAAARGIPADGDQPEGARRAARLGALVQERLRGGDARRGDRPRRPRLPRRRGGLPRRGDGDGGRTTPSSPPPASWRTQLPYPTIIGFDERSATLHYHGKRGTWAAPGKVDARRRRRLRPRLRLRHHPDLRGRRVRPALPRPHRRDGGAPEGARRRAAARDEVPRPPRAGAPPHRRPPLTARAS